MFPQRYITSHKELCNVLFKTCWPYFCYDLDFECTCVAAHAPILCEVPPTNAEPACFLEPLAAY